MLKAADTTPIHIALTEGMKAWVDEGVLFDMDPAKTALRPCKIIGFSSYANEVLGFRVVVQEPDGSYASGWAHVPPHLLFHKPKRPRGALALTDIVYENAPGERVTFTAFPGLAEGTCWAYFKHKNKWMPGEYLGTFDWPDGNTEAHLIKLKNGQFALLPAHKIQFNGDPKQQPAALPGYKKLRHQWRLE